MLTPVQTFNVNREELAWAAGFIDGEGHFGLHAGKKLNHLTRGVKTIQIQVSQIYREPLDRLKRILKIGKVGGPYGPYGENREPFFTFRCQTFEGVQHTASILWPFLCSTRKQQAKDVVSGYISQPRLKTGPKEAK